ncbi:MAG: DUF177 domain-containing protein [Clostridia bacterium]|nr:DUF177 domain-containing protein [Clostridia bacterium]
MLDLKKLLDGSADKVEFTVEIDNCDFVDESVNGTANAFGEITNHSGLIELNGKLEPNLSVECARCGKVFKYIEPINLFAKITDKLANADEDEFIIMQDFAIDIDDIVRSALILELPTRFLCKEDCKGLCEKCGQDLNNGECSCNVRERDSRWDVLKDFFSDEDE